jgi:hypothetical protein
MVVGRWMERSKIARMRTIKNRGIVGGIVNHLRVYKSSLTPRNAKRGVCKLKPPLDLKTDVNKTKIGPPTFLSIFPLGRGVSILHTSLVSNNS